jgi:hypothetical protein
MKLSMFISQQQNRKFFFVFCFCIFHLVVDGNNAPTTFLLY